MVGGPGVAIEHFAGDCIGNRHLAPVDVQRLGVGPQGHPGGVAVVPDLLLAIVPLLLGQFMHAADLAQQCDFLIQRRMRIRLAGERKVALVADQQRAEGLMTVEIIAQERHRTRRKMPGIAFKPAFGGPQFAVLLLTTILRTDKLRLQRHHPVLAGRHDQRRH